MLKVGIIGAGNAGGIHAEAYQHISDVKVAGVYDLSVDSARNLAEKYQAVCYQRIQDLMDDKEINIINICLPTPFHCDIAVSGAKRGKHIFCEKPIAGNLNDGRSMVNACRNAKVKFMACHILRYSPEFRKAKELVDNGKVGKTGVVRSSRVGPFPKGAQDWYAKYEMSGGVILDTLTHSFDFLRWCFGPVERVYAKGLIAKGMNRIDYALVTLRFKSGVIAHVEGSWAHTGGMRTTLEVAGDKGLINFDSKEDASLYIQIKDDKSGGGAGSRENPLKESPHILALRHFVDCVRDNREPEVTAEDTLSSLEISLAAIESIKRKEMVNL
ncbi:MAG: Gfo/Idh/MocA family oxidoreductase [Candidatus Omnitrophica bacterium]|nr:Gfo/Idh/MocA family oxidoreductase [Candidatus Omnitrophota bacterium]